MGMAGRAGAGGGVAATWGGGGAAGLRQDIVASNAAETRAQAALRMGPDASQAILQRQARRKHGTELLRGCHRQRRRRSTRSGRQEADRMKSPDQTSSNRRQWLIAAAAMIGVAVFAYVLWKPKAEPVADVPADDPAPMHRPPKFNVKNQAPTEPTILPPSAATPERVAACHACEDKNRGGLCVKNMGCDGLTGEDRVLCDNLRSCLRAHAECNTTNPAFCFCGEAKGLECITAPKGPCVKEAIAATKTDDMMKASERFFRPEFPSGRASQVSACHIRACKDECLGLQL
jgi:hypothetical protein